MKFIVPEQTNNQLPIKQPTSLLDKFADYRLYDNLAIYIMKPDVKSNFKDLANIINNGMVATSWAIRIYYLNNIWTLHIAPHPELKIDFNLYEKICFLFSENKNLKILGHLHLGIIHTKNKTDLELIVNKLIEDFSHIKLSGVEIIPINENYQIQTITSKYKIPSYFKYYEQFDEPTYKKYLIIVSHLTNNKSIPQAEIKEIIRISKRMFKNKILIKSDLNKINKYAEQYLNTNYKIKIALTYLNN